MSNWTVEAVVPYLPECSAYNLQYFWDAFPSRGVGFNLSDAGGYVFEEVVPSLIPGIVFGVLALLGFLAFLLWMSIGCCMACCGCCCGPCNSKKQGKSQKQLAVPAEATQQFIYGGSGGSQASSSAHPGATTSPAAPRKKCLTWANAFWAFFLALGLAVIGIAAWGLASSIFVTDTTVSDFWSIVDSVQVKVENATSSLQALQQSASNLVDRANVLAQNQPVIVNALERLPFVSNEEAVRVAGILATTPQLLSKAPEGLGVAVQFLQDNINDTITSIVTDFKPPTLAVQEIWRFLPIAILFGVTIVVVALVMLTVWFMSWPKTACFLVALLWLCIALLMLGGTGLLQGVHIVSSDACLFAETFAVDVARRKAQDSKWGGAVVTMVGYYLGRNITVNFTGLVTDVELQPLLTYLPPQAQGPVSDVYGVLKVVRNAAVQLADTAQNQELSNLLAGLPTVEDALQATGNAVVLMAGALDNLVELSNRRSVNEVYGATKSYICCDLKDTAWKMWVAWTVEGCLGFLLAILCSARIVKASLAHRKKFKAGQSAPMGGAVLWAHPAAGQQQPPPPPQQQHQDTYDDGPDGFKTAVYEAPKPAEAATEPYQSGLAPPRNVDGGHAGGSAYAHA